VSLCPDVDVHKTIGELNSSVGAETHFEGNLTTLGYELLVVVTNCRIEQFKQTLQYITPATSSVTDVLDACLPADFILLLLSSTVEVPPSSLSTLRSILSQGTPTIIPIVANLMDHTHPKTRAEIKKSLLSYIQQYIPTTERVFAADERGDAAVVMRLVCTGIPHGIRWREQRSYILPEGWRWDEEEGKVVFWGTVRGRALQVDRLLDLGTWGEFQIDKVEISLAMY
jgi:pre-rRNA-processing protein TSR1